MEDNIINLSDYMPHVYSEVICIRCGKRWISGRPQNTELKTLECPGCHLEGCVIETGETNI